MKKSLYFTDPTLHTFLLYNNLDFLAAPVIFWWGGGGFRYNVEYPRKIKHLLQWEDFKWFELYSLDPGMGNLKKNLSQKANNCLHICPPLLFPITAVYCTTHFQQCLSPPPPPEMFWKQTGKCPLPPPKKDHLISLFLSLPSFYSQLIQFKPSPTNDCSFCGCEIPFFSSFIHAGNNKFTFYANELIIERKWSHDFHLKPICSSNTKMGRDGGGILLLELTNAYKLIWDELKLIWPLYPIASAVLVVQVVVPFEAIHINEAGLGWEQLRKESVLQVF